MSMNSGTLTLAYDDPKLWIYLGDSALQGSRYAEAESWYRQVLERIPDDFDALNNLGTAVWLSGRLKEAEVYYRRALEIQPEHPSVLNNVGSLQRAKGELEDAASYYRRALKLQPDRLETSINLGVALSDLGDLEEACRHLRVAVLNQPAVPDAHLNLGVVLTRLGLPDEAIRSFEEALRLRPEYAEAHRNRAMYRLSLGDFARGWPEYEWRWRCQGKGMPLADRPLWQGENLEGRSILLYAEQGLGDAIQFVRYAPLVKARGGKVIVVCAAPLVRLFERVPGVDRVVARGTPVPETDYLAYFMSLPAILGTTLATIPAEIPSIEVETDKVERWRTLLDTKPGLKVGVAWQGNRQFLGDIRRSFPLELLAPLAAVPGNQLISLQYGDGLEQLDRLDGRFMVEDIFDRAGMRERDFLDAAALVRNLDLVVTPDSSMAHLAGALGVPVWVALPYAIDWRWLRDREDSPWYPSMRLFRQSCPGDWEGVFQAMVAAIPGLERLQAGSNVS